MTVIADNSGALSLGGIIGGEASGCTEATTEVFLEVALFDAAHIAQTGRALQIESDARYRFERGVDPDFVETGALLAIRLLTQLCGGEASELTLTGKTPQWQRTINFTPERVKTLGGVDLAANTSMHILSSLGFTVANHSVSPPSWRGNVEDEADLIEEILRIHGYDHIPPTRIPDVTAAEASTMNAPQQRAASAKHALAQRGMLELCTWSFLPEAQARIFGGMNAKLKLLNPISEELNTMRPSLLPNLLEAAKKNAFRGFRNLALFEAGLQFHDITPDGQRMAIAGLRTGYAIEHLYNDTLFNRKERAVDAFDAKADALSVLQTFSVTKYDIITDTPRGIIRGVPEH